MAIEKKWRKVIAIIIMGVGALLASGAQVFTIFGIKISGFILGGLLFLAGFFYLLSNH